MEYGAIILAAGASTRMGRSKQLLKIDGQTLLKKTVSTVLSAGVNHTVVVLGANAAEHEKEINDLPVSIIINPNWKLGIGSSIKAGVKELTRTKLDGFFILVCDQPFLTKNHLAELIKKHQSSGCAIVASQYAATIGVPALFSSELISTLLELNHEEGAKQVIKKNIHLTIPFDKGEIDLDTWSDYQNLIQHLE